jgi:hypothetical protein
MKPLFTLFGLLLFLSINAQPSPEMVTTPPPGGGIQRLADSVASSMTTTGPQQQPRKIKIIKKDVHYSAFISLAIGMMVFIALILTTPQTYNPSE